MGKGLVNLDVSERIFILPAESEDPWFAQGNIP